MSSHLKCPILNGTDESNHNDKLVQAGKAIRDTETRRYSSRPPLKFKPSLLFAF